MIHRLKTHADYFELIWQGVKTFELRRDDRQPRFAIGDTLLLMEWDAIADVQLMRWMEADVPYLIRGPRFGLEEDHVVMAIRVVKRIDEAKREPWERQP